MAIKIGQEFERTSKATRFKDDVMTKAQMLACTDDNYSDGYLVVEKDSHDLYIYDSNATPSQETGKFVKSSGTSGETPNIEQVLTQGDTATDKQIRLERTPNVDTSLKFSKISGDGVQTHAEMDYKNRTCYNSLYPHMFYMGSTRPGHQGEYTALRIDTGNYDDTKVEMEGDMKDAWRQALDIGEYTLQPATATTLGGVKVGSNLTITNNGVLSADKVVEEFNSNTDYGYSDIARACRRNIVYVGDGTDKRKPVVFFELNDSTSTAILYTAEKNGFSAYKWTYTEYAGKTTLTTIPNGGTTGQVLAKKSNADQDFDWETIVSDGWGVAKAGSVQLTSTSGSHIPFQQIDITDLGLTSTSDYEILVTAEAQRSTAYRVDNVFANKISATQFEIGFYTASQDGLTINLSYIVVAKGFQSIMGSNGGGTLSSGFGLTLNNNEISLTKCAVESVISNGYTKFYDKNDQGALFKPSENGMRYVYGDMGAETGEEIELTSKQYVDANGGKIDKIKVNGTEQTITNKAVDLNIPTAESNSNHNFIIDDNKTGNDHATLTMNSTGADRGVFVEVIKGDPTGTVTKPIRTELANIDYVDSKSPIIVNEGATFTNAAGNQQMQIRTGGVNSVIIKDLSANGSAEYWSYELPAKPYVDTELAKKGNTNITFDQEYQYLQIRDTDNKMDIGFSKETNDTLRIQEYAQDDRGATQTIFDVQLPNKTYVDTQLATKQDKLTASTGIKIDSNNYISSEGVQMEVGAEKWYGTYTEDGVTYQVYSKIVYIPALPSTAGITTYPMGVSNIKQILNIYGYTTDGFILNAPRQNVQDNISIYQVSKGSQTFSIEVGKDRSSKKAYVTIIYAKNNT